MKFLNNKEQVLDIQITSYGKYLLSKGKFSPKFYSFFDDGVLYDSEYAGFNELQKDIQNRIKNETPRLEMQSSYVGVESTVSQMPEGFDSNSSAFDFIENLISSKDSFQNENEKNYFLKYPIGTSDPDKVSSPAWNVNVLSNSISSSLSYFTASYDGVYLNIPQVNLNPIVYKYGVGSAPPGEAPPDTQFVGPDGSFLRVFEDEGDIILAIEESNAFFGNDNFEVEVYLEETNTDSSNNVITTSTPLYFRKQKELIRDGLLIDESEDDLGNPFPSMGILNDLNGDSGEFGSISLDPTYVEYYLSMDFDSEIDQDLLCELTIDKDVSVFTNSDLNCLKRDKPSPFNTSNVFETDANRSKVGECDDS